MGDGLIYSYTLYRHVKADIGVVAGLKDKSQHRLTALTANALVQAEYYLQGAPMGAGGDRKHPSGPFSFALHFQRTSA